MSDDFGGAGMGTTAEETYDFTDDGIKAGDHIWTITDAEEVEKENGVQHSLKMESETFDFSITVREWIKHTKDVPQRIGRGNLKKIALAALGQPKYTLSTIKGAKVLAKVSEKDGFANLSAFRAVPAAVPAVEL